MKSQFLDSKRVIRELRNPCSKYWKGRLCSKSFNAGSHFMWFLVNFQKNHFNNRSFDNFTSRNASWNASEWTFWNPNEAVYGQEEAIKSVSHMELTLKDPLRLHSSWPPRKAKYWKWGAQPTAWMSSLAMTHRLLHGVAINYRNLLTQVSNKWCTTSSTWYKVLF